MSKRPDLRVVTGREVPTARNVYHLSAVRRRATTSAVVSPLAGAEPRESTWCDVVSRLEKSPLARKPGEVEES
jgi:hypothetical protein